MRAEVAWREEQCGNGPGKEGQGLPLPRPHWGLLQVSSYLWACFLMGKKGELGSMPSKDPFGSEK